jgi:hypothetical protein
MKKAPEAFLQSIAAAVTAGVALWLSRASFDVAGTTSATERVAMLPSLAELMGFIVISLLVAVGMALLVRRGKPREEPFWDAVADSLLPLFGLSLLILPYLPWLADWFPALRLLAGPGRVFVWVIVVGQVLWILLPHVSSSKAASVFALASVAFSTPFVLTVLHLPMAFVDLFRTVGRLPSATLSAVPRGSLGVLFDQEYGILGYAPVLALGFIGLAGMLRDTTQRRLATALSLAALLLIVLPGTLTPWWSRTAMPGEQLVLLLPLFILPIAWLYERLPPQSLARAGAQVLLLVSIGVTLAIVVFRVPLHQNADGSSGLLEWMSPAWRLWSEAPTYVVGTFAAATAHVLVWLAVFGAVAWLFSRRQVSSAGRAALTATLSVTLVFLAVVSATSLVMSDAPERFDVEGRALFPLLETFDPVARPIAVRYNAMSVVRPDELPPLFTASAVPGGRTAPQPVRVVLNARFRLPAGEYRLDLSGSPEAASLDKGSISLQIGREGAPVGAWPITGLRSGRFQQRFQIPLDAEFVGFRALRQVEGAIAELRVTPVSVVETRRRVRTPTVLSAAALGPAVLFFHDSNAFVEREGFWVKGRAITQLTLKKMREGDLLLAVHSGSRPNTVTLTTTGWSQKLDLVPGVTQRVTVPTREGVAFLPFTISATDGFVPAEIEGSRDTRVLGAWIAFIPDDISKTSSAP